MKSFFAEVMTTYMDRDIDIAMARAAAAANQCFVFDINGLSAGGVGRSSVFEIVAVLKYNDRVIIRYG